MKIYEWTGIDIGSETIRYVVFGSTDDVCMYFYTAEPPEVVTTRTADEFQAMRSWNLIYDE